MTIDCVDYILNKQKWNKQDIIKLIKYIEDLGADLELDAVSVGTDCIYIDTDNLNNVCESISKYNTGLISNFTVENSSFDLLISKNSFELTFFYTLSRQPVNSINKLINLIKNLYLKTTPLMVLYYDGEELEDEYIPTYEQLIKEGKPKIITGLTILSPKIVKNIGKDRILSAPVYKVEELDDGGLLILLDENPFNHSFLTNKVKEVSKYLLGTEF
ncbi:hypothetical protein [Methanococcus aeolicus]|uniref:Uncharacterized protein n=1 Tax=Methanococcus aeolicus (strain ATCC BAA-1280 / DSM 17508 / OCM 812 / Nankai-3) TaxID=419665 RepID=A6UVM9_META3|nr:hypothetical protein [Methanococcus aeolicus]ABR56551.1 hypothetical protein Maeo_0973 [Methanococcus aeolicus Nankai-3]UXM84556.1 hypothetical protein N6C89_07405 [Methanococcus aeolicus]